MPEIIAWNKIAADGFCVSGEASHGQEAGLPFSLRRLKGTKDETQENFEVGG